MNFGNSGIPNSSRISPICEMAAERMTGQLKSVLEEYFLKVQITTYKEAFGHIVGELNNQNAVSTSNDQFFSYLVELHNGVDEQRLLGLYVRILSAIAAGYLLTQRASSESTFYTGTNIGANMFYLKVCDDDRINPGNISSGDMNDIRTVTDVIANAANGQRSNGFGRSQSHGGYGQDYNRSNGGFDTSQFINGGNRQNQQSFHQGGNSDDVSIVGDNSVKGIVSATSFGGGHSTHTSFGNDHTDNEIRTEVLHTSSSTNTAAITKPSTKNDTVIKPSTPKVTGELKMAHDKWEELSNIALQKPELVSEDGDDFDDSIGVEAPRPFIENTHLRDSETGRTALFSRFDAARHGVRELGDASVSKPRIATISYNEGFEIDLTEEDVENIEFISDFIKSNETIFDEDDVCYRRNTYYYAVEMIQKIKDRCIRKELLSVMEKMINNGIINRCGIAMMVENIVEDCTVLTNNICNEISRTNPDDLVDTPEVYKDIMRQLESDISAKILELFKVAEYTLDDEEEPIKILDMTQESLMIALPLKTKELGLKFKPLVPNRVTKNGSKELWNTINMSLRECQNSPENITIYTADGDYLTVYVSVFSNGSDVYDIFDLDEKNYFLKM